jgi:hypothetical protein
MDLARAFSGLARMAGAAFGGPYVAGEIIVQATPGGYDDDGVFQPGLPPQRYGCLVQIDQADWAMRQDKAYVDGQVRFFVLRDGLGVAVDTDARVEVLSGPNAGEWLVSGLALDPVAIAYAGRAVRA